MRTRKRCYDCIENLVGEGHKRVGQPEEKM